MAQPDYDFEYSWEDLEPVRPLFVTVLVVQTLGLVAGVLFGHGGVWAARFDAERVRVADGARASAGAGVQPR